MQKLEVKSNENGKYIEYKGVVLAFEHTVSHQFGEYDFFDMKNNMPTDVYEYDEAVKKDHVLVPFYLRRLWILSGLVISKQKSSVTATIRRITLRSGQKTLMKRIFRLL